jgi:hypothetical protein
MGKLWRWNGHRTRSGSRAPERDLAWQLPAPTAPTAPPGFGQADAVPYTVLTHHHPGRLFSAPGINLLGPLVSWEHSRARKIFLGGNFSQDESPGWKGFLGRES